MIFGQYGGVVGAFNCQGAGWDSKEQRIKGYSQCYKAVTGKVHVSDIEWDQTKESTEMGEAEEYAVYLSEAGKLFLTKSDSDPIEITIQPSSFEIYSFVPISHLGSGIKFAPIGLTDMFNCGGSIHDLQYDAAVARSVKIEVKGGGNFLAYSSASPKKCILNGAAEEAGFDWSSEEGKLVVNIPWIEESGGISNVTFVF